MKPLIVAFLKGWYANLAAPMRGSNYRLGDLVIGTYGGLWAYSGWDILNMGTGEIAQPRKLVLLRTGTRDISNSRDQYDLNFA